MLLDNRTLLFSLMLISSMMALSLAVVSFNQPREGLRKWAGAVAIEAVAWQLIGWRGQIPDILAFLLPNLLMALSQAIKLAAIHQFRKLDWPRWQCMLPVLVAIPLFAFLGSEDTRLRMIIGSLLYGTQLVFVLMAMWDDAESRLGRAWHLLFYSYAIMVPLLLLRAAVAFLGQMEFATSLTAPVQPNPVQLAVFTGLTALNLLGSMGFILMIKERGDREVRSLAMTDSLTKIFNRRAFMDQAEKEIAAAHRSHLPFALLMMDIDHFKRINDTHGHATGDAVLVAIAGLLGSLLRKQDTLGRYGGEEFCILLPGTDKVGAFALAEKLRTAVADMPILAGSRSLNLTLSIGISVWHDYLEAPDRDQLLDDADQALYLAKNRGRNMAVIHSPHVYQDAAGGPSAKYAAKSN